MGNRGKRLMEVFSEPIVVAATTDAIRAWGRSASSCQATRHRQGRTQTRKPRSWSLSLFAGSKVKTTSAFDYAVLVSGRAA
jgi:hypothetical protein